ncbi:Aldose 1-epimerase [Candidatus Methylobacter favarea]|uniref:Aldose 1-epimerase n=1 Tax=Candidatus Methylobacter favarea TaxID=2707345 RepID=A0A8S0WA88_9GAMM|nr:aldose epimerase family protein [Candidatus Methylobacter favarea]CAA9890569.1 Aldose 1-epimerase [Candidatus Methylobacter favarea]
MSILKQYFGSTDGGQAIDCYTLTNDNRLEARIMTYGGILVSLRMPDRQGALSDVVLGFDSLAPYLREHPYFGALIGRYANRIARGRFLLNDMEYQLACNNGPNHLHGGVAGFDKKIWQADAETTTTGPQLTLSCKSPDGEEGYPANVEVEVGYTLTQSNELRLDYSARTDAPTIINLTSHAYFNLAGHNSVLGHRLRLIADHYLPVDETLIPTGEQAAVAGTPMDFRQMLPIGHYLKAHVKSEQLQHARGGYDHNWVLIKDHNACTLAAEVLEPSSGRRMQVYTTQPGIQFYSGNFLDGAVTGKRGQAYQKHAGLCLETQHFPDSPNHPDFPSTVLMPSEIYRHTTIYQFGIADD